jgi:hypothetical protein
MSEQQFYRVLREVWVGSGELITLNRVDHKGIETLIEKGIIEVYQPPAESVAEVDEDEDEDEVQVEEVNEDAD